MDFDSSREKEIKYNENEVSEEFVWSNVYRQSDK